MPVKILSLEEPRAMDNGTMICEGLVGDETGTVIMSFWNDECEIVNDGMTIELVWTVDGATIGNQKVGFSNAGSTVITGIVILNSTGAKTDVASIHATTNNTKNLEFDADAADHCGGAEGTVVRVYYQAANKVFAEVRGITSAATPALDTNAASATGWS